MEDKDYTPELFTQYLEVDCMPELLETVYDKLFESAECGE